MSKFEKGNLSLMMYKVAALPAESELDMLAWITPRLEAKCLQSGKPGVGWSNQYPGHIVFDEHVQLHDDAYRFMFAEASVVLPKGTVDAACKKAELEHKETEGVSMLSRKRMREIRENVEETLAMDAPINLSHVDVIYMPASGNLLIATSSVKKADTIASTFVETFEIEVTPVMFGHMSANFMPTDHQPLLLCAEEDNFSLEDHQNIMARDFLMWLWYWHEWKDEPITCMIEERGPSPVAIMVDGPLTFINEEGGGAHVVKVDKGLPTLSREAKEAILRGKKLQKAKVAFGLGDEVFVFQLQADTSCYGGLKLPDGEAMDKDARMDERLEYILMLDEIMRSLVEKFVEFVAIEENRLDMQTWAQDRMTQ